MIDFTPVYDILGSIPLECLQSRFMQQAVIAMCLLSPMTAVLGVEVVNFRMAFFSDAIGHSAFAGVALGLMLSVPARPAMLVFGIAAGLAIMLVRRHSRLSEDTAIGIVFSALVAFGLVMLSRTRSLGRELQQFLYGDILVLGEDEITLLLLLFVGMLVFQTLGYNRLLAIALNPVMARVHGVSVRVWQYVFAALLALVVMFSVWTVGVLLVTALLVVPAATARNLAKSAGGIVWWAVCVSLSSGIAGLLLSAQDWVGAASGATVILTACTWFAVSCVARHIAPAILRRQNTRL